MPEDDELEVDGEDQARVEDMLLVEALMGWDGERFSGAVREARGKQQ